MRCISPGCDGKCNITFCQQCIGELSTWQRIKLLYQNDFNRNLSSINSNIEKYKKELPLIPEKIEHLKELFADAKTDDERFAINKRLNVLYRCLREWPNRLREFPKQKRAILKKLGEKNMEIQRINK
jgi:hypothetical protein